MISVGHNIKSITEQLVKMPVKQVYDLIKNPRPETAYTISQLRVVKKLNPSRYAEIKQRLPYMVCGVFNPAYRKSDNFVYTEYFVIDIDHIADKGIVVRDLRREITKDPRTVLCFVSPGGDGLKVMFKISERCHDAGLYRIFYKVFADRYSRQFDIEQVVDTRTCDVARACFLSSDPEVYFNPEAETINVSQYINPEENPLEAFDLKTETDKSDKHKTADGKIKERKTPDPGNDIMDKIRQTLNPVAVSRPAKAPAYVPAILNEIMDRLTAYISEKGVVVDSVENIQYGKKMKFHIALKKAEINLFYGKRGFSVVQSPRTGTNAEANALMAEVIGGFLAENGL